MHFKIILFSVFVFSVLGFEQNIHRSKHLHRTGIPLKISEILKRSLRQASDENPIDSTNDPNDSPTDAPIVDSMPKEDEANELPKEGEVKEEGSNETPVEEEVPKKEETTKEDLNVKKEGERIEREDESEEKVTPESPKAESMTPSSVTPLPPVTKAPTTPSRPSVPPITIPTVPANRPVYPLSPEFPSSSFPNYWQNPNWGNWGRFVPTQTANWPGPQWPTFNSWPSMSPSVPSVPSVSTVAQIPSFNPSNYNPTRQYSPFAMIPSSGVPTFSFLVPQNPSYGGGRGFQYPGVSPSVPNYSGYQPPYQPRYIPSGGPTQGLFPGIGGRTPGFYPSVGQRPSYFPGGSVPQSPRYYPGESGPTPPETQPGADPNRPMGPMGPEFNNPDATMIDPNLMRGNDSPNPGGIRRFPSKFRRTFILRTSA